MFVTAGRFFIRAFTQGAFTADTIRRLPLVDKPFPLNDWSYGVATFLPCTDRCEAKGVCPEVGPPPLLLTPGSGSGVCSTPAHVPYPPPVCTSRGKSDTRTRTTFLPRKRARNSSCSRDKDWLQFFPDLSTSRLHRKHQIVNVARRLPPAAKMEDALGLVRDQFYMGYYQKCLEGASVITPPDEAVQAEREALVCRARMLLGRIDSSELARLCASDSPALRAIGHFNSYRTARDEKERNAALEELKRHSATSFDATAKVLTVGAHTYEGNVTEALELTRDGTLELQALRVQILLMMHRPGIARSAMEELRRLNDEAAVTRFAEAICSIAAGAYQEADLTYGDIQIQCGEQGTNSQGVPSTVLLNGKAVANMQRKQWQEALEDLNAAYKENPTDDSTLVNLICYHRNMLQHQEAQKYYSALAQQFPSHPMVQKLRSLEAACQAQQRAH